MAFKRWRDVLLGLLVAASLVLGYIRTLTPVRLHVDGQVRNLGTHQTTVEAALRDAGVKLLPLDRVSPSLDTRLERDMEIYVTRARTVTIEADGRSWAVRTHESSAEALLAQQGIRLKPGDRLLVNGEEVRHSRSSGGQPALAGPGGSGIGGRYQAVVRLEPQAPPTRIAVLRAIPLHVDDNGAQFTLQTTSATIGEALREAGMVLYLGDHVEPSLNGRATAGLHVQIRRSLPLAIQVDGRIVRTRTFRASVGEVFGEIGVSLVGLDYAIPPPDSPLVPDMVIRVVRVWEEEITEQETIPFRSTWQPSPDLEIDATGIIQIGQPGVLQRRIRIRKEDGQEVARSVSEWVALDPVTHVNGYGTQIVPRILDTPDGPVEYWRVIRMLATSYTESTAGKAPDHPTYGITYTGLPMRYGIVAVDPRIINLRTYVYVPGYGTGFAADTGGWIKNYRIDLGYDDSNFVSWYSWVNVYLLTPAPDPSRIRYVLPGSPAEGQ